MRRIHYSGISPAAGRNVAEVRQGNSFHSWEISCSNPGNRHGKAFKASESNYKMRGVAVK
jgi:hypothetical protein